MLPTLRNHVYFSPKGLVTCFADERGRLHTSEQPGFTPWADQEMAPGALLIEDIGGAPYCTFYEQSFAYSNDDLPEEQELDVPSADDFKHVRACLKKLPQELHPRYEDFCDWCAKTKPITVDAYINYFKDAGWVPVIFKGNHPEVEAKITAAPLAEGLLLAHDWATWEAADPDMEMSL